MIDAGFLKSGRAVADAALARDRRFRERLANRKED
jgi:hypothetical protein